MVNQPREGKALSEKEEGKSHLPFVTEDSDVKSGRGIESLSADDLVQRHEIVEHVKKYRGAVAKGDKAEERALNAEKEARTDGLTKVSNRKYLDENLSAAFSNAKRHSRPLSVIMLDVDHFKLVNDLHSHAWGDTKLKQIADILKSVVREEDCVARYGGEEFAIVLPETDINGALVVAEKVRKLVEAYALDDREKLVDKQKKAGKIPEEKLIGTISVGCTEFTEKIIEPSQLLADADDALFASKRSGRNKITVFYEGLRGEAKVAS